MLNVVLCCVVVSNINPNFTYEVVFELDIDIDLDLLIDGCLKPGNASPVASSFKFSAPKSDELTSPWLHIGWSQEEMMRRRRKGRRYW